MGCDPKPGKKKRKKLSDWGTRLIKKPEKCTMIEAFQAYFEVTIVGGVLYCQEPKNWTFLYLGQVRSHVKVSWLIWLLFLLFSTSSYAY